MYMNKSVVYLFVSVFFLFASCECRPGGCGVNIAYEWDAVKQKLQSRHSDFRVDWSGCRAQAGLIF